MNRFRLHGRIVAAALGIGILFSACGDNADSDHPDRDNADGSLTGDSGVTGTTGDNQTATPPSPTPPTMTVTDPEIFAMLAAADSMEIEMGKLARTKARSADIKAYAKMMIDDHTKMKSEGAALAKSLGITPTPPASDQLMQQMEGGMQHMGTLEGTEFDKAYMDHAVSDHQNVLDAMNTMLGQAQNDSLKMHIQKGIPTVQKHLDRAKELQNTVNSAGA